MPWWSVRCIQFLFPSPFLITWHCSCISIRLILVSQCRNHAILVLEHIWRLKKFQVFSTNPFPLHSQFCRVCCQESHCIFPFLAIELAKSLSPSISDSDSQQDMARTGLPVRKAMQMCTPKAFPFLGLHFHTVACLPEKWAQLLPEGFYGSWMGKFI